ncbi:MAG TPA: hypothetical protein VFQ96_05480 [Microbacteriaceae bacterium]|nr:hypothetical protein [Microbacteriaceae bacterium]
MADLNVYPDRLQISLTRAERTLARRRRDLVVERGTIASVTITSDPWIWIRGLRDPGVFIPLTLAVGTWKFHGGRDFLLVKGHKRAAVVVDVEGEGVEFGRLIVSTPHAVRLAHVLRLADPHEIDSAGETI